MRKKQISRSFFIILTAILLLVSVSCGGDNTPAHTHTLTKVEEVAATCTAAGTRAHWHCTGCGADFADEGGTQPLTAAELTIAALSHDYKNGYCTVCGAADPGDRTLEDGTTLRSASVTKTGILSWSKLKIASKYVVKVTLEDGEHTYEVSRTDASLDLTALSDGARLAYGKNPVSVTVYRQEEVEIGGERGYQEVPVSEKKYAALSLRGGYELVALSYEDDYITIEGFYGDTEQNADGGEYLLSDVVIGDRAVYPTLKKDLSLKGSGDRYSVYASASDRENDRGSISRFTTAVSSGNNYYYVRVWRDDAPLKDYDLVIRGVRYLRAEFAKESSVVEEDGTRVYSFDYLSTDRKFLQGDYMNLSDYYSKLPEGYLIRDNDWNLYEKDGDYRLPVTTVGKYAPVLTFYAAPAETLRAEAAELDAYRGDYFLTFEQDSENTHADPLENRYVFRFVLAYNNDSGNKDLLVPSSLIGNRTAVTASSFSFCDVKNVTFMTGFTELPEKLFFNTKGLESVAIPDTVTSVGDWLFPVAQKDVLKIYCEGRINSDGHWNQVSGSFDLFATYYGCVGICSSVTKDGYTVRIIGDKAYVTAASPDNTADVPRTVRFGITEYPVVGFRDGALAGWTSFRIPAFIETMNFAAFDSALTSLTVEEGHPTYLAESGILYNAEGTEILYIPTGIGGTLTFPATLTALPENLFAGKTGIRGIVLGDTMTAVGKNAFRGCTSLSSVTMTGVTEIDEGAFDGCTALSTLSLGNALRTVGKNAFSGCTALTSVTLSDTVTTLGSGAFRGCHALAAVTIGSGIDSVADETFADCTALSALTLGRAVESIGDGAFRNCRALTSLSLVGAVRSVGNGAFAGCTALAAVTFGENVRTIGNNAFDGCGAIADLTLPTGLESIGDEAFRGCASLLTLTLPDSVRTVGNSAFALCPALRVVRLGGGLTALGANAFASDNSLLQITLGAKLEAIGDGAFSGCYRLVEVYNLSALSLTPGADTHGGVALYAYNVHTDTAAESGIREAGDYVFYVVSGVTYLVDCYGNESDLTLPSGYDGGTYILRAYALADHPELRTLVIPRGVTSIEANAFGTSLQHVTSLVIGEDVTRIAPGALSHCSDLRELTLPFVGENRDGSGKTFLSAICGAGSYIDNYQYLYALRKVTVTGGAIAPQAFYNCQYLTEVILGEGVTSIGGRAFYNCSLIATMQVSDTLSDVASNAFLGCTKLLKQNYIGNAENPYVILLHAVESGSTFTIPAGTRVIYSKAFADFSSNVKDVIFPENGVRTICDEALAGLTLTTLEIPASVTHIGFGAFYRCNSLRELTLPFVGTDKDSEENAYLGYLFGAATVSDNKKMIPKSLVTLNVLGNITYAYAINGSCIETVRFGDGVTVAGGLAGCTTLTNVTFGKNVSEIGQKAFYYCTGLKNITLPATVTKIGEEAFGQCTGLTSLTLPAALSEIGQKAFTQCTGLTTVTLPDSLKTVRLNAFEKCTNLKSVHISSIAMWCGLDFQCGEYTADQYANPLRVADGTLYLNGEVLTDVVIPDGVTSIGAYVFTYCKTIKSVTIPASVRSLGQNAFFFCSYLSKVTYDGTLSDWLRIRNDGSYVLTYATGFYVDGSLLTNLTIPDDVTEIPDRAFMGYRYLKSLTVGSHVERIGRAAFRGCENLKSVTLSEGLRVIDDYAFNTPGLKSLVLPASVTDFGTQSNDYACKVYYLGTSEQLDALLAKGTSHPTITFYVYSAEQPTESGNYWHYNSSGTPTPW